MPAMSSRRPSRLDPDLIARKGQATPAPSAAAPAAPDLSSAATSATASAPTDEVRPAPRGLQGTIAVTVRLDPTRYERLKVHGVRERRTNQDILVEALDDYLRSRAK